MTCADLPNEDSQKQILKLATQQGAALVWISLPSGTFKKKKSRVRKVYDHQGSNGIEAKKLRAAKKLLKLCHQTYQ